MFNVHTMCNIVVIHRGLLLVRMYSTLCRSTTQSTGASSPVPTCAKCWKMLFKVCSRILISKMAPLKCLFTSKLFFQNPRRQSRIRQWRWMVINSVTNSYNTFPNCHYIKWKSWCWFEGSVSICNSINFWQCGKLFSEFVMPLVTINARHCAMLARSRFATIRSICGNAVSICKSSVSICFSSKKWRKVALAPALKLVAARELKPRSKPCIGRSFLNKTFGVDRHFT